MLSVIKKIYRFFKLNNELKLDIKDEEGIKISDLVNDLHNKLNDSNESLNKVGLKYIESYFYIDKEYDAKKKTRRTIDELKKSIKSNDNNLSMKLLSDLENSFGTNYCFIDEGAVQYRPKMVSIISKDHSNVNKETYIPLFLMNNNSLLKINDINIDMNVNFIRKENEEIYVKLVTEKNKNDKTVNIKLSFKPEGNQEYLNNLILKYNKILCS
ncbi:MAG: hypothetical protein HRU38_19500 [Saccharospirillaceae bacterium]|nr:hypothetical protein [Pseudomonadales bacterium]NRB80823.1 hypothetical protein [Saccharospirillaceae bacterium]